MSTMTRPVTAPAGEKPDRTRVTKPLVDFASLATSDEDGPITRGAGGGDRFAKLAGTPFEGWVQDSYDKGKAKSVTLANQAQAKQVASMLRLAASKLGLGVRVPAKDNVYPVTADGKVKVVFQGTDRRKYDGHRKPTRRKAESSGEFAVRVAEWEKVTGRKFNE